MALYSSTMIHTQFDSLLASVVALQESHSILSRKIDKVVSSAAQYAEALSACSKAFSEDEVPETQILPSTLPSYLGTEPTKENQIFITPAIVMGSPSSSELIKPDLDVQYPNDRHEAITAFIGNGQFIILDVFRKMLNMECAHLVFDEMLPRDIFEAIGAPNRDIVWHYFIESRISDVHWVLHREGLSYNEQLPINVERVIQTISPKFLLPSVSPKVFDDLLHSCCPKVCAEAQLKALLVMPYEGAIGPEHSAVQLFNAQRDTIERYVTAPSLDRGFSENQIEFEPFDDMYLADFFMELETIVALYLDKWFTEHEDDISTGDMSSTKMIHEHDVKHGKPIGEVEHAEGILLVVSVPQIAFSMNLYSPCKDCSTIVVDDFNDLFHKSVCHIANTFIDQHLSNQFSFSPGVTLFVVTVCGVAMNLCVWGPGISSQFMTVTGSIFNVEAQTLFEASRKIWSCLSAKWSDWEQLDGFELGVESIDDIFLDICFRIPYNIEDRHLDNFFMEYELEKTMSAYKCELILMFLADIEHHEQVLRIINLNYCTEIMTAIRETILPWREGHLIMLFVFPGDNMLLHLVLTNSIKCVTMDTTEALGDYWAIFSFIGIPRARSYDGDGRTLFDGSSTFCDSNTFPCPSIAGEEYTLVINEYFEVKHEVVVAEFQHFSVSYHGFSYALGYFAQPVFASDSLYYWLIVIEMKQPLPSRFILVQCDKLNKVMTRVRLCSSRFPFDSGGTQHKQMGNVRIHGSACSTRLTLWLVVHDSFSFLESNLEDKILIEGGSIVVNGPRPVLTKQPDTTLSGYVWDPG